MGFSCNHQLAIMALNGIVFVEGMHSDKFDTGGLKSFLKFFQILVIVHYLFFAGLCVASDAMPSCFPL